MKQRRGRGRVHEFVAPAGDRGVGELLDQHVGLAIGDAVPLAQSRPCRPPARGGSCRAGRPEEECVLALLDEARGGELVDHLAVHLLVEIEVDLDTWYLENDDPPDEIYWTPQYVSDPYGNNRFYRLEATLGGGGWVSTAPDLCRIAGTVLATHASAFAPETRDDIMKFVLPDRTYNGWATGNRAYLSISPDERVTAYCMTVYDFRGQSFELADAIDAILELFDV